ncbi:MAG: hypothetical protein Q7T35_00765 [Nitrosomonas sp.]|nr:hypothetical protein [Nitrosomonas sp.]
MVVHSLFFDVNIDCLCWGSQANPSLPRFGFFECRVEVVVGFDRFDVHVVISCIKLCAQRFFGWVD